MRRPIQSLDYYVAGIRAGDRVVLGQAITLVESTRPEHGEVAQALIAELMQAPARPTFRIAITGAPGVGKSTFIEALGTYLTQQQGLKVAVLAIDPSSALSQGSILGDKTRMERLSTDPSAFVRPSPAGTTLGGVARKTRESVVLVEAAGYEVVLIETVGVGQSEIAAQRMTDAFLLLLLPGAGDELQGIKRGIVEMSDIVLVNKADGDRLPLARQAQAHYRNALHLFPARSSSWTPQVQMVSAVEERGVAELWATLNQFRQELQQNGYWADNRQQQAAYWLQEALTAGLQAFFEQHSTAQAELSLLLPQVLAGVVSPFEAAKRVLERLNWPD
jgi:LAO/AO transport system kinase